MLDRYAAHLNRRLSPASVHIRTYWIKRLSGFTDPIAATTDDLWEFLESNPKWTPNTRVTIVSSFHVFYKWAQTEGLVEKNPAAEIPQPRVPKKRSRIATDSVIRSALNGCTLSEKAMIMLGAECGLRVSEIATLSRDNRDEDWLEVTGKGGVTRSLNLSPELAVILDEMERTVMRWGFYFPSAAPRKPVAASTIWRHIRALTGLNTHALRHRAGTATYRNAGFDLRLAQEFLGHASPATTAIYVHVEREQLARASAATRLAA